MKTNKLIAIAAAFMLAASSCGDKEEIAYNPNGEKTQTNFKDKDTKSLEKAQVIARSETQNPQMPDQFDSFIEKLDKFSGSIAEIAPYTNGDNIAISPASIYMVLAMASECSNGPTQQEILNALGMSYMDVKTNTQYASSTLNKLFKSENCISSYNSIWAQNGFPLNDDCLSTLSKYYLADVFNVDFMGNANSLISSYIYNSTRGFLDINLNVSKGTLLMLMNVLYVKDLWNRLGIDLSYDIMQHNFKNADGSISSNKKLLRGEYELGKAIVTEKYRKFYISTDNNIKLTFIVPNDGYTLSDVYNQEAISDNSQYEWEDNERYYMTRCIFPEFKAEFNDDIKGMLQKMGIKTIFDSNCDFSMICDRKLHCSEVKHVTKLEVNKEGIEGAAVTAMSMETTSVGPRDEVYEDFVVDRAFAYTLSYNGIQIFNGVVTNIK